MRDDRSVTRESASVTSHIRQHDPVTWHCHTRLAKLVMPDAISHKVRKEIRELETAGRHGLPGWGEAQHRLLADIGVEPEIVEVSGNLLMYGGASCQWQTLIGNGTATADQALTFFSNARAAIGVGDSATAAVATTNDLVATTNKVRVAMDATYPLHTDGTNLAAASVAFRATFGTAQANFTWNEWGIFNSVTAATGRMLNRRVENLGTKTSAGTNQLTLTLSLS